MSLAALLLALLVAKGTGASTPQARSVPTVAVGPNIRVSAKELTHVEPFVAAHPDDPGRLVVSASAVLHRKGIVARAYLTRDGGLTWAACELPPAPPQLPGAPTLELDCWVTYAPDGTAFYSTLASLSLPERAPASLLVYRSPDGGERWLGPAVVRARSFDAPHMVAAAGPGGPSRFFVAASQDGGRTFALPEFVAEIPRVFPHRPRFVVDSSPGTFRGRVYAAWDGEGAEGRNASIAHSNDGGKSWSVPVVLRAGGSGPAYFTCAAVSRQGTAGVAWIQHESAESPCYRVWFAASVDGGERFTTPYVVSDAVSCPDGSGAREVRFPPDDQGVVERWPRGGDYIGVAAAADGSFHPVWSDCREGAFQTYAARVVVGR